MIPIINAIYFFIILFFLLAAIFIVYHIVKYSLSKMEMLITLAIFISVFLVLIFSNMFLFFSIRMDRIIGVIGN